MRVTISERSGVRWNDGRSQRPLWAILLRREQPLQRCFTCGWKRDYAYDGDAALYGRPLRANNRRATVLRSHQRRHYVRERVGALTIAAEELSVPCSPVATSWRVAWATGSHQSRSYRGYGQGRYIIRLLSLRSLSIHGRQPRHPDSPWSEAGTNQAGELRHCRPEPSAGGCRCARRGRGGRLCPIWQVMHGPPRTDIVGGC